MAHKYTLWGKSEPYGPFFCDREDWRKCKEHKGLSVVPPRLSDVPDLGVPAVEGGVSVDVYNGDVRDVREVRWVVDPRDAQASLLKAEKIIARANKKGLDGGFTVRLDDSNGLSEIVLTGEPYRKNGWVFVASVELLPNGEKIVKKSPYYEGPDVDESLLEGDVCQHCNVKKRRKVQIVIENDSGERMILGSTCVKDFLGWNYSPVFSVEPEELKEKITGGYEAFHEPIVEVLSVALAVKELYGFQSASADSEGMSTKAHVLKFLQGGRFIDRDVEELLRRKDFSVEAGELIRMVEEDAVDADNDYLRNMRAAFTGEEAYESTVGLIVSSILMAERKKARDADAEARAKANADIVDELYAPVGSKVEVSVKCVGQTDFETSYGFTTLYTFVGDNYRFKWFSSSEHDLETGADYRLKGTVKQLNEYNGQVSTVLTRCKVMR